MEEYRDVIGYEGMYQVSTLGNVKSVRNRKERVLSGAIGSLGYRRHVLSKKGESKAFRTHQLVAQSFLEHKINRYEKIVDHIDNNKLNNSVDNLQVVSARENVSKNRAKGSSKHRGVSWCKSKKSWVATIYYKGKQRSLKQSKCELKCACAYNKFIRDNNLV